MQAGRTIGPEEGQPQMSEAEKGTGHAAEAVSMARERYLDDRHAYGCAETVFTVLKSAYGLPDEADPSAASALNGGIAYSGGTCGALTGAALAVGLLAERRGSPASRREGFSGTAVRPLCQSLPGALVGRALGVALSLGLDGIEDREALLAVEHQPSMADDVVNVHEGAPPQGRGSFGLLRSGPRRCGYQVQVPFSSHSASVLAASLKASSASESRMTGSPVEPSSLKGV